ncbi:hypothetical protein ACFQ3R_02980 [Mesonia ostreae]|uniref:Uncharacterized protein n=1 Tax=Mesonia ostreae TaxID=861110 RepID=A0ABU2KL58_9FLAO|nr:hypothetical protein [Mesonia ostreae]MDT0295445.1 hypothetical protein [Mesonia ostreae]
MIKKLLLYLVFLISTSVFATDGFKYALKKHQKFNRTMSIDINKCTSVHFLFVKNKNTKQQQVIPFYVDEQKNITELSSLSFEDEPELISFHTNGTTLTLINFEDGNLSIDDIDLSTGKHLNRNQTQDVEKPEFIFKQKNKSIFVEADRKGRNLTFTHIENSTSSSTKELATPKDLQDKVKDIFKTDVDVINTREFVKNGSIAKSQAYFEGDKLLLVYDEKEDDEVETLQINPNAEQAFEFKNYKSTALEKLKKSNSYVNDDKLFVVNSGKEDVEMNVFDIESGKKEKRLSLQQEMAFAENDLEKREDFIKQSRKFKNKPTLTVNETQEGNLAVRMDYVNIQNYSYHNMWWFHHHMMMHQMHIQQHQQMNMMMGPNISSLDIDALYTKKKESTSISFVISKDLELLKDASLETKFREVDAEKYIEELSDNKEVKNESLAFLNDEYHYIYTDRKEDVVFIKIEKLE